MTNTENLPQAPAFIDTPTDFEAGWAQPGQAFRYLNLVASTAVRTAFSVNLSAASVRRQEGIRDLVNHGLVSERRWVGGEFDGRVTLRLTELGEDRLSVARSNAARAVMNG